MTATASNTCAAILPDHPSQTIVYKNCLTADSPFASSKPGEMGPTHILFTPHELIEKLIALIPRPRCHLVRYHGILGPAAKDRAKVVPTPQRRPRQMRRAPTRQAAANPARSISPGYQESAAYLGPSF